MKTLITITCAAVLLLAQGCTMKDLITPVTGSSSSDSYQPVTKGSVWTYNLQTAASSTAVDVVTIKMTGNSTLVGGKTYYEAVSSSASLGTSTGYFYSSNSTYVTRGTSIVAGVTVNFQYLDISKGVGVNWITPINETGYVNGIAGQFSGRITEKDVSKTIGIRTFPNVVHTVVDLQYDYGLGNGFETACTYDYYVAKGIGLIELDCSAFGVAITKETINTYTVK